MPAITSTVQDVWPPRVLISVTGLTIGDVVTLYRVVAGQRTPVRGAADVQMTDTSLVRVDAEQPFGVPVSWVAVVDESAEYSTADYVLTAAQATSLGGGIASNYAVTLDADAADVPVGARFRLYTSGGTLKEPTAFTVSSKDSALGFTNVFFTPNAATTPASGDVLRVVTGGPLTVALPGGKVALSDAVGGTAAEVVIVAWPERRRERRATTFRAGGRTVVVAGPRGDATGTVEVFTEADSSRENLSALLSSATSGVVQVRQAGGYAGVDAYLAVLADTEVRWSQDGSDQRRRWTLDVAEVEPWPAVFEARGFTLADLAGAFTGQTLSAVSAAYGTLLALAQADLGV